MLFRETQPPLPRFWIAILLPIALISSRFDRQSWAREIEDAKRMWRGEWT